MGLAMLYVNLIVKGLRKFSDVPSRLKEKVKELLVEQDLEDLTKE